MDRSVNQVTAAYYLRQQEEEEQQQQQQKWGTTEFIALNQQQQQQQQMMMMAATAASGLSSIGEQQQVQHHPKFQVDDVVLAELMDMEIPFCSEQILVEQPWMSSSNCSPAVAAEFAFNVSGHQHHLYSNRINSNSNSNSTTFTNLQAGCLPPPANSFWPLGHPIPSPHFSVSQEESEETHGSDFTTMPPPQGNLRSTISVENFAELLLLGVTANNSTEGEGEEGEAAGYSAMMPGEQLQSLIPLPPPPPLVQCRSFSRNHETAGGGGILQHNSSILCYEKALEDLVTSSSSSLEKEEARSSGQVKQVSRARSRGAAAAGRLDHHGLTLQERTMRALQYIGKACVDVLVQVWMPMKTDDNRLLLTTREQPFVLEHKTDHRLWYYRTVSEEYEFAVTSSSPGLPGRVFLQQVPEWTPNVQFYNSQEYLRVKDAQKYDVRGTLAVPVFEPSSRNCLAVIELVMGAEKLQYAPEIDIICRALQVRGMGIFLHSKP